MGLFMFTVIISLAIHTLAVLPLLYFVLTRRNPYTFMRVMSQVMLCGFPPCTCGNLNSCCSMSSGVHHRIRHVLLRRHPSSHNPVLRARGHKLSSQQLRFASRRDSQHERNCAVRSIMRGFSCADARRVPQCRVHVGGVRHVSSCCRWRRCNSQRWVSDHGNPQ